MKVRPGGLAGASHFTDGAASFDGLSILDVKGGEMAEMGLNAEAVVKYDRDTEATSHPGVDNFSIRWCDDRHSGVTTKSRPLCMAGLPVTGSRLGPNRLVIQGERAGRKEGVLRRRTFVSRK